MESRGVRIGLMSCRREPWAVREGVVDRLTQVNNSRYARCIIAVRDLGDDRQRNDEDA